MNRSTLLLLLTVVGVFYAWRTAQAAPPANGAAPPAPGPGSVGFGEDLALPPADPYARAELDAGPDSGTSSVLGGKLDWPFFVAVGASNAINRLRRPGGITADHLLPVEPIGSPAAPSSSSSYSAPSSGGYGGGFQPKGGGSYAIP